MSIVLFEDPLVTQLYPVTTGRAAFTIACGSYRLIDIVRSLGQTVRCLVRPHLWEVQKADFPETVSSPLEVDRPLLVINSRLVPSVDNRQKLRGLLDAGQPGVVRYGEAIAAAVLPPGGPRPQFDFASPPLEDYLAQYRLPPLVADLPLFEYPHDIVRHHMQILRGSLEDRIAAGGYEQWNDGVFVAPDAKLGQHIVTDTKNGPVLVDAGAVVGPYVYLSGPAYLGPYSRVLEHSAIKDAVALGHTTKVGGEVEASIIEPYTNKQHHGFLGHSYLGSWINLGAGTCNSDLKNTYGQVNMEYAGRKVPTGMQFVGSFVGDYAKTAINTGIFTGKTIGVCSMVYGFVTTNVPSFVNYARLFGQVTELPVEVMVSTQARMFARRNVVQRPCDIQLLHAMYALTSRERQLAGEPLAL
ncbi:MAG: putative sugar nucleotidyl transferase [Pirellulales bacterium]